jgi:hypothetical protein
MASATLEATEPTPPRRTPHERLWAAVVAWAWVDAFGCQESGQDPDEIAANRAVARTWLTWTTGDFMRDREEVAGLAGVDADALREAALRRIAWEREYVAEADVARKAQLEEHVRALDEALSRLVLRAEAGEVDGATLDAGLAALAAKEARAVQDADAPLPQAPRLKNLKRLNGDPEKAARQRAAYARKKARASAQDAASGPQEREAALPVTS